MLKPGKPSGRWKQSTKDEGEKKKNTLALKAMQSKLALVS